MSNNFRRYFKKNKTVLILVIFSLTILIYNGCSEDNNPADSGGNGNVNQGDTANYIPVNDGNYYKYSVEKTDSSGTQTGKRSTTYSGTQIVETTYQVQIDSLLFSGGQLSTSTSLFRKTESGLFYFIDTTGFSNFIPPDLPVTVSIDTELRAFAFPIGSVPDWPSFLINASLGGLFNLNVISDSGFYAGTEQISLNLSGFTEEYEAAKIRYVLNIRFPTDPNNPTNFVTQTYDAFVWLVKDIGIVKLEGNGTIINLISGGGVDLDDTTSVVTQTLTDYRIRTNISQQ